jgi:hypothetical protein
MARGPRPRRRLQQRCTETRWRTDPVCLRSRRCRDLPQPADERPISSVRDSSVASCLPQPRWPPLKALALVAGRPLATLGTTAGRPRASRRSPPSRRCVRAAVRAWTDRAGAAADGDELEQHPIRVAEASAVSRAWRRVAIPGGVAERPQDAVVANVRAPSRCKNMRCFFLSFLTATHEYLVAT